MMKMILTLKMHLIIAVILKKPKVMINMVTKDNTFLVKEKKERAEIFLVCALKDMQTVVCKNI